MAGRADEAGDGLAAGTRTGTMQGNGSALPNASQPVPGGDGARPQPSWLASALACVLIFTIVVDILGNLLVILSVYRNKKLRNAGRARAASPGPALRTQRLSAGSQPSPSTWFFFLNAADLELFFLLERTLLQPAQ